MVSSQSWSGHSAPGSAGPERDYHWVGNGSIFLETLEEAGSSAGHINDLDRKESELRKDGQATAAVVSDGAASVPGADESPTPSRPAGPSGPSSLPGTSRIDALLQQGEGLYSMGMYEHAIHVWTRILFLDKNDARAKQAIDRGKRGLGERQRVVDEELAMAANFIEHGDLVAASSKLQQVLAVDPRNAEGHQLVEQIAVRKRRPAEGTGPLPVSEALGTEGLSPAKRGLLLRVSRKATPQPSGASGSRVKMAGFALAAILVFASGALYLYLNWGILVSDGAFGAGDGLAAVALGPEVTHVPSTSELRYYNGERLFAKGRYREALAELARVGSDSPVVEQARGLTLRIEERLLRGATEAEARSDDVEPAR